MRRARLVPILVAILTFVVGVVCSLGVAWIIRNRSEDRKADTLRSAQVAIEEYLNLTTQGIAQVTGGIADLIEAQQGQFNPAVTQSLLEKLVAQHSDWRNMTVAPANRMDFIAPRVGNEEAIGKSYEELPRQWPGIKAIIDSGNPAIQGPITLVQGGNAFIYRQPVTVDGRYWGMVSVVVDAASFDPRTVPGVTVSTATLSSRGWGDAFIGDVPDPSDPDGRTTDVSVPGQTWQLTVTPAEGRDLATPVAVAGGLLAALAGAITFLLLAARQRAAERIRRIALVADEAPSALFEWEVDEEGNITTTFITAAFVQAFPEFEGRETSVDLLGLLPAESREQVKECVAKGQPWKVHFEAHTSSADRTWFLAQGRPGLRRGDVTLWRGSITDVTDEQSLQVALKAEENARAAFIDSILGSATPTAYGDLEGVARLYNQAVFDYLEVSPDELTAIGGPTQMLHPEDLERYEQAREPLLSGAVSSISVPARFVTSTGKVRWADFKETRMGDYEGMPTQALRQIVDLTDIVESRNRLQDVVDTDDVTGFHSRSWLERTMAHDLSTNSGPGALMMIDLTEFMIVNRQLGRAAWDEMLRTLTTLIAQTLGAGWALARLDGPLVAAYLPALPDAADTQIEVTAGALLNRLEGEFHVRGLRVMRSASIGVALVTPGMSPEAVMRDADEALTLAKARGRSRWAIHSPAAATAGPGAALRLEDELLEALRRRQFVLFYQPKVRLSDRQTVGFEALVRWRHPVKGILGPDTFIDAMEASGLITRLGPQVLDMVCAKLVERPELPGSISVNVSAVELTDTDWLNRFLGTVTHAGVVPERITVELTETTTLDLTDEAVESLIALRRQGFGLELDDFGTGYASLGALRSIPFSGVKLDGSFVAALSGHIAADRDVVEGIASLARGLRLARTAEGVETAEQARLVAEAGWEFGQGHLFGVPGPEPVWDQAGR